MQRISPHISYQEAVKSATAIRHGIDNKPSDLQLIDMRRLALDVFEPLRARFNRPIGISSFFRSAELNKKIGGSSRSQHCCPDGQAAMDIDADVFGGIENREIFEFIRDELPFDQLIWEFGDGSNPDWVHVSLKSTNNRKQILKAVKHGSKTLYLRY